MSENGTNGKVYPGELISTAGYGWELPVTDKMQLFGLNSIDYEHPLDRQALQALETTPGLSRALSQFLGNTVERSFRLQLMASGIRVTDKNFPQLYKAYHETCEILDMPHRPPLYISNDPRINAFAAGSENPMIAFTSEAVSTMGTDELRYIIGHELGHIKSNHGLYRILAELFKLLAEGVNKMVGFMPLIAFQGVGLALMKWSRMAEFTCDRAGLLACQNLDAAIRANLKLAGLPTKLQNRDVVDEFIRQARDFEEFDSSMIDRIMKDISVLDRTHPWTVVRAKELLVWYESGEYDRILKQCQDRVQTPIRLDALFCPYCGDSMKAGVSFCGGCGAKVESEADAVA